jgi:hypothetical protein
MFKYWNPRSTVYLVLSIIGLVGCWYFNILAIQQGRDFLADWNSTPAVSSATTDLLITASAASIFIIVESKRIKMKYGWLYVIFSFVTAIAFTFPLFLAMRERKLLKEKS